MKYSNALLLLCTFLGECIVDSWQAQAPCPVIRIMNGRVRARARGRIVRFSCIEGFTLVGNKYSTCIRGQWDTPIPVCVNTECPLPPKPEHALIAPKYGGAILLYFCEPGYALIGATEIYCDGRQWNGTAPYCRDTSAATPTKCDFEKPDLCWWEQDPQHDFDWRRHNFETPSSHIGTGPTHDHTLGPGNEGYYLYVEASGRLVNDTARIVSPIYNSSLTESGCFSFWYHMYGATMGTLHIYFKQETESTPQLMFTKEGNQGNQWLRGIFDLPKSNKNFQIVIEGVRGQSYVSDIAIDDVAILQGAECNTNKSETGSSVTMPDDDQIELINAMQSCRGRCENLQGTRGITILPPSSPDACQCTMDCADTSMCCPDYAEYCILGITDDKYVTEAIEPIVTAARNESTKIIDGATAPTTRKPATSSGDMNSKDEIDPNAPEFTMSRVYTTRIPRIPSTAPTTTTSTTRKPTIPSTKTKPTTPTTRKNTTTSPATTTTKKPTKTPPRPPIVTTRVPNHATTSDQKIAPKETPFSWSTTVVSMAGGKDGSGKSEKTSDRSDPDVHVIVQETQTLHRDDERKVDLLSITLEVIGTICVLAAVVAAIVIVIQRRKGYKRGSSGSALSEDSDVRFLTSDEILDFNLARPNDNDEL